MKTATLKAHAARAMKTGNRIWLGRDPAIYIIGMDDRIAIRGDLGDRIFCGACDEEFVDGLPDDAFFYLAPSGNIVVKQDQGVHKCLDVTREDELAAIRWAAVRIAELATTG